MDIDKRTEELALEYINGEGAGKVYQGHAPGTPEWEAAIWDASGLVAMREYEIWSDAANPRYPDAAGVRAVGTPTTLYAYDAWRRDPAGCQAIYDRVQARGY